MDAWKLDEDESKIYDLLRFYKQNNQEIQLICNGRIKVIGIVRKLTRFIRPSVVVEITDGSIMKVFIEDIINGSILPAEIEEKIKIDRQGIPKAVRNRLWYNHFGDSSRGTCQCCGKNMGKDEYEAGHIKSHRNGGSNDISNLTPLCRTCNRSMGAENFDDYVSQYHKI